jgi:hypothetical protein
MRGYHISRSCFRFVVVVVVVVVFGVEVYLIIIYQVGTQGLRPKIPPDCPHAWARLIADCWAESPDERPDFQEILARLDKF